ncbi:MAG: CidA/LrgA family protein [Candidatus Afipia apatlaquensis]|uniref:CidA/LrgA family protein n=1 Tax=Candidatus Afipia apatlaquensis TaxID=2712852 RepID=A0A7C9RJN0_9BRAD|nr:CidA/LrgA family protein [Candidatus Afipia apatlaquensis]
MIASLSVILICQLIGEVIVRGLRVPVPGPVVGLALLVVVLITRDRFPGLARGPLRDNAVEGTAKGMLAHLSLLFVPAGVGVVQQLDLLAQRGLAIFVILAASVLVTLVVTVGTFLITSRLMRRGRSAS